MPSWMKTWFGDPTRDSANAAGIQAIGYAQSNIASGTAPSSVTFSTAGIASHSHSTPDQWLYGTSATVYPIKRWKSIYGAVIEVVREIAEAAGGTVSLAENDGDIELDLVLYRAERSAIIDLAFITNLVVTDRIEDVYRYIEVTLAMLPPAPAHGGDLASVQNMHAQSAQQQLAGQQLSGQQLYSNGWVSPHSIFGSGI